MSPWAQRILTILAAVGVGSLGGLVPATAAIAMPAATFLLGWALQHPADGHKTEPPKP